MVGRLPKNGLFIGLLALLLLVASCKKKTIETKSIAKKTAINTVFLPYSYTYKTIAFRAKIDYNDGKMDLSFNGNFRIQPDSLIWISFTGPLGIEVARTIISPDSVRVWNKLQGEKICRPISYITNYFPVGNFYALQDFLLGNPLLLSDSRIVTDTVSDAITFTQDDINIRLVQQGDTKNYTVVSYLLKDKMLNQTLDATFGNQQLLDNHFFSCERTINILRGAQQYNIKMDIYKFQSGEALAFPF